MSHHIPYRCYGSNTFGTHIAFDGIAGAEAMYRALSIVAECRADLLT